MSDSRGLLDQAASGDAEPCPQPLDQSGALNGARGASGAASRGADAISEADPDAHGSDAPAADSSLAARAYFPRGLAQAEGAFRFSADALLLAAFAASAKPSGRVLELGAGCGAAGFALLLLAEPEFNVAGLDIHAASVAAARANARLLGLEDRFTPLEADLRTIRDDPRLPPEFFDLVMANPPYRVPGSGLVCPGQDRARARFETDGTLDDFLDATVYVLGNRRPAAFVFLAERLPELLAGLAARRLEPKRMRLVHGRADAPARLVLVEARKNGRSGLVVEPPLILYEERDGGSVATRDALAFCPFLACNAERTRSS